MKRLFKSSQPKFAFEEFKTLEDRIALRTSKSIPNFILCVLEPPNCKKEDTITMLIKETDNLTRITIAIRQKKEINPTQALFFYCKNTMLDQNVPIKDIQNKYSNKQDGILYIHYSPMPVLG